MEKMLVKTSNGFVPKYAHPGDSGMDLCADSDGSIHPGARALVTTGLRIRLPAGYEGQIRSRSGLALKFGVAVLNSPGTIDHGYTGELGVILVNHGHKVFTWKAGDRIAQLVVAPVVHVEIEVVADLDETERGAGGFGSTGQ